MKKIALKLSLVLFVSLSFTACQDDNKKEKTEVETLQQKFDKNMKETVAIHDEVMPKMAEINKLHADLEVQSPKMDDEEYQRASAMLEEAHMEMMSWMKKFSNSFDSKEVNSGISTENVDDLKAKNELLDQFKTSAESMQTNINRSLEYGRELHKRYE